MKRPRFGLRLPLCSDPDEAVKEAVRVEQLGWDILWIPDGHLDSYECWVNTAAIKLQTDRIDLGLCVTNPRTRHPSVTACAACTLDQLGDERRLILGMGVGDSVVRPMGERVATRAELREGIALIRELQNGRFVRGNDREFRLFAADGAVSPIYISATGRRMLQLAGEIADGVITLAGVSAEAIAYVRENLDVGARRANRSLADVDVVMGTWSYFSDDFEECLEQARPICAFFMIEGRPALERAGIEIPPNIDMSGLYPDVIHAESWEKAIELTKKWLPQDILEEFVEKFLVVGSGDAIRKKLEHLVAEGIGTFYIRGYSTYQFATDVAVGYSRHVFPYQAHDRKPMPGDGHQPGEPQ